MIKGWEEAGESHERVSGVAFAAGPAELGQLAFVGIVLAAWGLAVRVQIPMPPWSSALPAYGIGSLAAYWCIERAAGLIP